MDNDAVRFKILLDALYDLGGSPEYVVIPGIGELYWPALSEVEKAYAIGYKQGWTEHANL